VGQASPDPDACCGVVRGILAGRDERKQVMSDGAAELERRLGVSFRDRELLALALVHPSYVNEHLGQVSGSNQRLEFLGDAVVDAVIAEEVYLRFPAAAEGQLTVLRAAVVRDEGVGRAGRRLGLGELLLLGLGEESTGGRQRASNMADAFEAVVGAMFLDQGYDVSKRVVLALLAEELNELTEGRSQPDAKSRLQEWAQQEGKASPLYRVAGEHGPDHEKVFEVEVVVGGVVLGVGRGRRKAEAEREAAAQAVETLGRRDHEGAEPQNAV